jgi:hypothetical protein
VEGYDDTEEAGVADNYISDFVNKQKEKSAKERLEWEELALATQIVLQEKVRVDEQAPTVWAELIEFLKRKVAEINSAHGNELIVLQTPSSDMFTLQCGAKSLKLLYRTATQVIQVNASFATKRKWTTLHAVADGEQVQFAENTTRGFKPLTSDEIMKGLLSSFVG